ncbi:glycosyltransferase [Vibrio splendidus]
MNILFLLPSLYGGGAEKIASKLMSRLSNNEHHVSLLLLESGGVVQVDNNIRMDVMSKLDGKYANSFSKLFLSFYYYLYYQVYLVKNRNDVVVSFLDRTNILNLLPAFGSHKKIISIRSHLSSKLSLAGTKGGLLKIFYKLLLRKADYIVVPSLVMRKDIIEVFKQPEDKVIYIPNGLNFEDISRKSKEKIETELESIFSEYNTIVNVGSLSRAKRQDKLISGFHEYKKLTSSDAKLFIVGEGDKLNSYIEQSKRLGMKSWSYRQNQRIDENNDIFFLGYKKNPYKYIAKSDMFVLTSEREGFPNVLVETLFLDTNIISSNCKSGPMEILSDTLFDASLNKAKFVEYGILLPVPEHDNFDIELARALATFDSQSHNNQNSIGHSRSLKYSDDKFYDSWNKLLELTTDEK